MQLNAKLQVDEEQNGVWYTMCGSKSSSSLIHFHINIYDFPCDSDVLYLF